MKKVLKFLMWTIVGILALVLVLLLTTPLWLGPTVATATTKITPHITGTPFVLEGASLNPYTGKYSITKLTLGNPEGYSVPTAFSVSNVAVDVEMSSLLTDTIHIREITIVDPYASYVSKDGVNNFEWIAAHAKKKIGLKDEEEDEEKSKKKVIIDRLTVSGTRVKLKILPEMPIPTITLTDIGKDKGGASWEEVGQMLADAFTKTASSIGEGLNSALGALGDGANSIVGSATNALGGASEALGDATKSIGDTTKSIGSGALDAGKSIGNGALDAGKAIGNGALDAGKSIGEGLKKLNPFGK